MIRFPLLQTLSVANYALYPGPPPDRTGFTTSFQPGLTLVLGANGLGKTTLVWLLYRMLSGPYDISNLNRSGQLGTRRLRAEHIRRLEKLFSQRVVDGAANGRAHLEFTLGQRRVLVSRSLKDLSLTALSVDGDAFPVDERSYQDHIAELAGVWSFGDWILLLRYLTFYFEDRRALVWDPTAQTQICRLLFLPPEAARQWTEGERQILKLDSEARNLNTAVRKEESNLARDEALELTAPETQVQLQALTDLQESDGRQEEELDQTILYLDETRKRARLALLEAEQEKDSALRGLEHAKLAALQARFPTSSDTAKYILAQLFAEGRCLACGNHAPDVAQSMDSRLDRSQCVVCASPLEPTEARNATTNSLSERRMANASELLDQARSKLVSAQSELQHAESEHTVCNQKLASLRVITAERQSRIAELLRHLPEEAQELHRRQQELTVLTRRVQEMREDLNRKREAFSDFIEDVRKQIIDRAPHIKETFQGYAREFLLEDCDLRWTVRRQRVGQSSGGPTVDFPVFELDLASASHQSPVRRSGPEEVSESQREFIDLAFRMAMMEAAAPDSGATLVIDAPESSLDTVFVRRAADVLAQYGHPDRGNRLVVTSNLTDGNLIARLLEVSDFPDEERRIVNLFDIAEPTAAVRKHEKEYRQARAKLLPVPN